MKLTDILPIAKEEKKEFYWSLVIEAGWVQAGIWSIEEGEAKVVSISPGAAWEVEDDLVNAADATLSAAIQNLPEEFGEPQKTVFGLPNSWISEGQIKEEYLARIKKICSELSLTPTGFVVISEAIAHLIKSEEGAPANAIVLGIGKEILEISVFKLGNLIGTSEVARSVSLSDDAIEGLARFPKTDSFPSRFLIYNGKEGELEEAKQSLLDADWEESANIKFLHTPKIEIILPDRKILATSLAGASEIGQVSKVSEVQDPSSGDISEDENVVSPPEDINPEELGFVVNEDVAQVPQDVPVKTTQPSEPVVPPPLRRRMPKLNFGRVFSFFSSLSKTINEKARSVFGKNFLVFSLILAIFFIAVVGAWWYLPTAEITVYVAPKTLEQSADLNINTTINASNVESGLLAGRVLETEVSGEKTTSTTGTKLVGEKAIGSVKIQNGLAVPVNLPAGTVLASANSLSFTTTKSASVSAALSPASPGVATVEVVASDIGAQFNLAKDESFKVGTYPKADVDGVSTLDFTGGSSRQITAVSSEDQANLQEELRTELAQKATQDLAGQVSSNETLVEGGVATEDESSDFSSSVGDEATNLKLSLTVSATTFAVNKNDLFEYSKRVLQEKVPEGYSLTEEEVNVDFEVENEEDGVYEVSATISVGLLPAIDVNDITKKVKGKYPRLVENYLASIPGFTRAEIRMTPRLPGFLGTLPHVAKRITVTTSAEK